jgi:predicted nucleic-acid-binding protein
LKALDTNILVRFLTNDDEGQALKVLDLFQKAEIRNESFFVPVIVLLELIWVLKAVYNCSKEDIIKSVENLSAMPVLTIENAEAVFNMLRDAKSFMPDLPDLLIAHCTHTRGCEKVITFDQKATSHPLFASL